MAAALTHEGGCRCGAIRFRVEGEPRWVAHCHCADCRRATSAALATYAGFPRERFTITRGEPRRYGSSPGVSRSFCAIRGTPLTYEGARWADEVHVFVCAFDAPETFRPTAHVYTEGQMPWLHLNDGLRRFAKTSAEGKPLS